MQQESTQRDTMPLLNPEQRAAVTADPEKPCLVIAGPGAGKTAVIAARCRYLIEEAHIKPQEILVLTFTRAAAAEMQERFRKFTGGRHSGVNFGTFHAVLYRAVADKYGFSPDNLVKENEKQQILRDILKVHYPEAAENSGIMEALFTGFSAIRAGSRDPGERTEEGRELSREEELAALYTRELRRRRKLDYDDILLLARNMLREDPAIRGKLSGKYRYILVDEFQDVSPVQADILKLIASPANRIFAVGDDDQAIYRFRGASPEIMLRFPKEYPGCKIVRLVRNYRSSPEIVKSALQLIDHNEKRYKKALQAAGPAKGSVQIRHFSSEKEEYRVLAEELRADLEHGAELSETALLFRTNAAVSGCLAELLAHGVPFVMRDQVQNPFRHFAAETVFAYINYVRGDHSRANFLKMMNCPVRYIRRPDLQEPFVDLRKLREFYRLDEERQWMTEKVDALEQQLSLLERLEVPYAMVNYIRRGIGLDDHYKQFAEERGLSEAEIMSILDFVQDSSRNFRTAGEWYDYIARYSRELAEKGTETDVKGHVILSTIHRAKGLEFTRVIVADVVEQNIPHTRADTEEELFEERRLFYVAMTRAKKDLRLYVPRSVAGRRREESRFLGEVRGEMVREVKE